MRVRLLLVAAATAATSAVLPAAPSGASHSCAEGIPCYPHICFDEKFRPYFC